MSRTDLDKAHLHLLTTQRYQFFLLEHQQLNYHCCQIGMHNHHHIVQHHCCIALLVRMTQNQIYLDHTRCSYDKIHFVQDKQHQPMLFYTSNFACMAALFHQFLVFWSSLMKERSFLCHQQS